MDYNNLNSDNSCNIINKPIINIENICRCCMSKNGQIIIKTNLENMINYCLDIEVNIDSVPPLFLCNKCYKLILQFNEFKRDVQKKDILFRKNLKSKEKSLDNIIAIALNDAHIIENEYSANDFMALNRQESVIQKSGIDFSEFQEDFFKNYIPPLVPISTEFENISFHQNSAINSNNIMKASTISMVPPPLVPISVDTTVIKAEIKTNENNGAKSENVCNVCKKKFSDSQTLMKHLKGHQLRKNYVCKICGKRYLYPSALRVHTRIHTGERPFKCHVCGKGFRRWANVTDHLKTHTSDRPYICETCGKRFKSSPHLSRHKILHSGSLPFSCDICGKNYAQLESLVTHIRSRHTRERPFLCSRCGKGFANAGVLTRHLRSHSGAKPHQCGVCGKGYANAADLRRHGKVHGLVGGGETEKKFGCGVCGKYFYHPCRLARHMSSYKHRKWESEGRKKGVLSGN